MKYLISITVIALVTCSLSTAHAKCYVPTLPEALAGAKAVFVGRVISVKDPTLPAEELRFRVFNLVRPVKIRFAVEHVYRGSKVREIEVGTKTGGLEWGYEFKVGEKYIVYAQEGGGEERGLIVKGCGRSRLVKEAAEDLKLLNRLSKPKRSKSPFVNSSFRLSAIPMGTSNKRLNRMANQAAIYPSEGQRAG